MKSLTGNYRNRNGPQLNKVVRPRFLLLTFYLLCFQDEILRNVGQEALELGLLMPVESEEDQTQIFGFSHQLFQEFTAGKFVATADKVLKTKNISNRELALLKVNNLQGIALYCSLVSIIH